MILRCFNTIAPASLIETDDLVLLWPTYHVPLYADLPSILPISVLYFLLFTVGFGTFSCFNEKISVTHVKEFRIGSSRLKMSTVGHVALLLLMKYKRMRLSFSDFYSQVPILPYWFPSTAKSSLWQRQSCSTYLTKMITLVRFTREDTRR